MRHKFTKTEIRYGRIYGIKSDGTHKLFSSMPEYFTVIIQCRTLENKRFKANKIYIGEDIMDMFEAGDIVEITKESDATILVELTSGDGT